MSWLSTVAKYVHENDVAEVTRLLDQDPTLVRQTDRAGLSLLHSAAQELVPETVELLLARGADPNLRSRRQHTPLRYALLRDHRLPAGTRIGGIVNGGFRTQVVRAAPPYDPTRRHRVVRLLLQAGAKPNERRLRPEELGSWEYDAPLVHAARLDDREIIDLLVSHGARVTGRRGGEAIASAAREGHRLTITSLVAHGARAKAADTIAAAINGALQREVDRRGPRRGPFFRDTGIESDAFATIEMLIDAGADVNRVGARGWRPIHDAVNQSYASIVELLIAHGAKLDVLALPPNVDREAPLLVFLVHCVLTRKLPEGPMVPVARALVRAGADRSATAEDGVTARTIAFGSGRLRLAWALL